MMRRLSGVAIVFGLAVTVALAQNPGTGDKGGKGDGDHMYGGRLTQGTGGKYSLEQYDVKGKQFGKGHDFPLSGDNIKVYRMKNGVKSPVVGGLKEALKDLPKGGAYITYQMKGGTAGTGGQVSEVIIWEDQGAFQKGFTGGTSGAGGTGGTGGTGGGKGGL